MSGDSDDRISIAEAVPFDPRRVGPFEVGRSLLSRSARWIDRHFIELAASSVTLTIAGWYFGLSIPAVPKWIWIGLGTIAVAAPSAWVAGSRLARWLWTQDDVLLSEQSATSGDQRLILLDPDRFESMTVVNQNDEVRERTYLHEIIVNGRRAFEVDSYDEEANLATASWQAGASNSEIRSERRKIDKIKTSLEKEADKAHELLSSHTEIVREQVSEIAHEMIRVAEDVELPGEEEALHSRLSDSLSEQETAESLIEGMEIEETSGADSNGHDEGEESEVFAIESDGSATVFERAKKLTEEDDDD